MNRNDWNFSAFDVALPKDDLCFCDGVLKPALGKQNSRVPMEKPLEKNDEIRLAQSMNQLSIEERDKALCDLHGVADLPEECPEMLASKLADISWEIDQNSEKDAYVVAKSMSPEYVTDKKFLLQFLRAEDYDPQKAAERMARYFERKLEAFGRDKLVKDIEMSDFSETELKEVESGIMMILDQKDRSGRTLVFAGPVDRVSLKARQKLFLYLCALMVKDVECQRRGMVIVKSVVGQKRFWLDRGVKATELVQSVPLKCCGLHFCYDDGLIRTALAAGTFVLQRTHHARMRFHYGTLLESSYALMGYGINCAMPVGNDSRFKRDIIVKWIEQRRQAEASVLSGPRNQHLSVIPADSDVLLGRGKAVRDHPGNVAYRHQIGSNREEYDNASKFEKSVMIETILTGVKEKGGRFLQLSTNGYFEVDDDTARKRISHSWRNLRASKKSSSPNGNSLKRLMDDLTPIPIEPIPVFSKKTKFDY